MAATDGQAKSIDGVQGVCVLLAIPFGLIPLGQRLFDAEQGFLFRRVLGEPSDPMAWVVPLIVLGAAVMVIAASEMAKKRL